MRRPHRSDQPRWIIDPELLTQHRIAAGITRSRLGAVSRHAQTVISRIERGGRQNQLSVAFLFDIAGALGVHPIDLMAPPPLPEPGDEIYTTDTADIGAILANSHDHTYTEDLAHQLDWTHERVLLALEQLDQLLNAAGQTLAWHFDIAVKIVPHTINTDLQNNINTDHLAQHGLDEAQHHLVRKAMTNPEITFHTWAKLQRGNTLGPLTPTILAPTSIDDPDSPHATRDTLTLSNDAKYALYIDDY